MKKYLLLTLFCCISISYSQSMLIGVYTDTYIFPKKDSVVVFFTYRVENNSVVFEKKGDNYSASFRFNCEILDSVSNVVVRDINEEFVTVAKFENTNTSELSTTGLMKFVIPEGNYELTIRFVDGNSKRETELFPVKINAVTTKSRNYLKPLIVFNEKRKCETKLTYEVFNYGNSFPFSGADVKLLIPVNDSSIQKLFAFIQSDGDSFKFEMEKSVYISPELNKCDNSIIIDDENSNSVKCFIIENFSNLLNEGKFTLKLSREGFDRPDTLFSFDVRWFNKPVSLRNIDFAIQVLKHIEDKSVIDSLLKGNSRSVKEKFENYWKRYDPTPETKYNELMHEFYQRVDFAVTNYSSLDKKNGADTDRGKTYLRFGKPDNIERTVSQQGRITEIWTFEKIGRKFVFVDVRGMGNFQLQADK
ncbi:MAG TPA: GWxTD domain-containing protein [Ignavibacteriaceae bacterium]|nr:GWxTD domain-containing protein [Ignavibacteriaceae bacterium]